MPRIAESELIINRRGAIYHLDVRPEEIAHTVILVGDPDRVERVSRYFDRIEFRLHHREFNTHTGYIGRKRISVLSTGIGPDNIDIALNELDALVNIDFTDRQIKPELTSLHLFRFGTSGSLQADIPVDSMVAGTHGLGLDNLMLYYDYPQEAAEHRMARAFERHTRVHKNHIRPYVFSCGQPLLKHFKKGYHRGITVTCPGFYGPQGRMLRLPVRNPGLIGQLSDFKYRSHRISNFEMETSAIYGLGRFMGHQCLSLNAIVANRVLQQFTRDGDAAVDHLIRHSLEIVSNIPQ